ncbi:MAG: glucoamylase family protein [Saprospiraceae bacterium]
MELRFFSNFYFENKTIDLQFMQESLRPIICLLFFTLIHQMVFAQLAAPTGLVVKAYDSHVELQWEPNAEPTLRNYKIYVSEDGGQQFELLKKINASNTDYIHFIGRQNAEHFYKITAEDNTLNESPFSSTIGATTFEMTDEALQTMVQEYTFRYFWDFAHPVSGLARERNTTSTVTSGGSGFGIMAILVGIERAFITREQGLERLLKIVNFLERADRFHGVFPHWMNGATGKTIPFSALDNGGDLVETAFLIQGLLTARAYFSEDSAEAETLRQKITAIWEAVEWDWYLQNNVLLWHWSPNNGFAINLKIRGYNEALIIYLLAIASPTHPIPAQTYHSGWASNNYLNGTTFFGITLDIGPLRGGPLFFAHYSFLGFDPREKKDAYTNYFIHNRNHTLLNRAYCAFNTGNYLGYSDVCWGLTASDDPFGYSAHEASPGRDNGTLTPTAALSSMPYTPEESMAALKHFYRVLGDRLWGKYGFYDAFNLSQNWFASSYLAIDQGPIIGMIENHRTGLLWNHFMENPEIQPALDAIGFVPDSTDIIIATETLAKPSPSFQVIPNPARQFIQIQTSAEWTQFQLFNFNGAWIKTWDTNLGYQPSLPIGNLPNGVYLLKGKTKTQQLVSQKIIIQH